MIVMMIMTLFFYFIVFSINRMSNERREQKAIYEELLSEFENSCG